MRPKTLIPDDQGNSIMPQENRYQFISTDVQRMSLGKKNLQPSQTALYSAYSYNITTECNPNLARPKTDSGVKYTHIMWWQKALSTWRKLRFGRHLSSARNFVTWLVFAWRTRALNLVWRCAENQYLGISLCSNSSPGLLPKVFSSICKYTHETHDKGQF